MYKKIIFIILILVSCDRNINESKGESNEIIIISSLEDKIILEPIINDYIFDQTINTPEPEFLYKKTWITPDGFKYYKTYSNIIIVSISNPIDESIDKLINEFKIKNNIKTFPVILNDIYAKPQLITLINESNNNTLKNNLMTTIKLIKENISNHIDSLLIKRYKNKSTYESSNNTVSNIADSLFSIKINVDSDFKIIDYNIKDSIFWIGKGSIKYDMNASYQWLIYKKLPLIEIKGNIDFQNIITNKMKSINQNVKIIHDFNKFSFFNKNNKNIFKLNSLYNHNLYQTGGPLICFLINDLKLQESLLIYGLINAPGISKLELIKELETIILNSNF